MLKNLWLYKFYEQVKQEAYRVAWPTRKDVMTSTGVVLLVVLVFSLVCVLLDYSIHSVIQFVLNLGK